MTSMATDTWAPPQGLDAQLQRVGKAWDTVRAPASVGRRALRALGEDQGAVIRDPREQCLYWLLPLATADAWQPVPGVHAYGPATWVLVPPADWTSGPGVHWARPPKPGALLTQPDALHAVLVAATVAEVLAPGGECSRCQQLVPERVMIGAVDPGSGPVRPIYGCLPCARKRVTSAYAPAWLATDLAVIDTARGGPVP